ncbi:MAG TPA: hypothetical protein PKA00_19800 [Saprospiraceae bacterium]|nr:hypothetical protein [Saprospiraceae bacterium]
MTTQEKNIWKKIVSVLLIFQVIVALSIGIFAVMDFPSMLQQFGMKHQPDMGILQMIMVYNLFLSLSIYLWSFIWIRKGNLAGFQAAITGGVLMFFVSFAVFIKFDRIDMLFFDSIRAVALVVFGLLAFKEHKKHHPNLS